MKQARYLREDEKALITDLVQKHHGPVRLLESLLESLSDSRVEDMADGGMGGVRFCVPNGQLRHFGRQLLEAEFLDADGVVVIVAINLDEQGELYELDLWKVDFSPLIRFPSASKRS